MSEEKRPPTLDVSIIPFPTDKLTMGQIRRLATRNEFSSYKEMLGARLGEMQIMTALSAEIAIAERAYAKARGLPDPYGIYGDQRETILAMHEDYVPLGISTGLKQTREMVLAIERAAQEQAKAHGGRPR